MRHFGITSLLALCSVLLSAASATALTTRWYRYQRDINGITPPDARLDAKPRNPFGVNIDLLGKTAAEQSAALAQIKAAGFGWVRQEFSWVNLEVEMGVWDWQSADTLVQAAQAQNLQIVAVLHRPPEWIRVLPSQTTSPPKNLKSWTAYAFRIAKRYSQQIHVFQIWDEPNLQGGWGGLRPSAPDYARVLQAAASGLRSAQPSATVLLAGLAPTVESGPKNYNEVLFLEQLYAAGAAPYFDAVAAKPYGFDTPPTDRQLDVSTLNFSRMILMRQVLEAHGDFNKLVWASHFGWNALPADWQGGPSVWGKVSAAKQATYTVQAYQRALSEWSWAGVLMLDGYQPTFPTTDPHWGFSLTTPDGQPKPIYKALQQQLPLWQNIATAGLYPADTELVHYQTGDAWRFSELGADVPRNGAGAITIPFIGSDLGLIVRRGDYRGYAYATVDGQPANALPLSDDGRAYAVLTSGDLQPTTAIIWLAKGLSPTLHHAEITLERGWNQWVLAGFVVTTPAQPSAKLWQLFLSGVLLLLGLLSTGYALPKTALWAAVRARFLALSPAVQTFWTAGSGLLLWGSAWLAWGRPLLDLFNRAGETLPLALTLLSAGVFYFSPWVLLSALAVVMLGVLGCWRPVLLLPLIAFFTPLYVLPRPLFNRLFSLVEILTLLLLPGLLLHGQRLWQQHQRQLRLCLTDWLVLAFCGVALLSTLNAELRAVAVTEMRIMVLEPAILYLGIRLLARQTSDVWRIVDFWLAGALLVAAVGLWQAATGQGLVLAEGGAQRILSIYGSPNNVGLYLGRLLPVALAVGLLGNPNRWRRWGYAVAVLPLAVAIVLSRSRGALILGVPAALTMILIGWKGRKVGWSLVGLGVTAVITAVLARSDPRLHQLFNRSTGATFFRLNLWQSTLQMIREHPWTGVGLDNFLYAYRGRYIAPAAWQDPNLSHAHNWLLDYAARLGIPGLAVALLLLGTTVWQAWHTLKRQKDPALRALVLGLLASLAHFLSHGLVDASYWFVDLAFATMLTLGLLQVLATFHQPETPAVVLE